MKRKDELLGAIEYYKIAIGVREKYMLQELAYFKIPDISIIEIYKSRLDHAEKELQELSK
jgi:hypothetical protein